MPSIVRFGGVIQERSTTHILALSVPASSQKLILTPSADFTYSTNGEQGQFYATSLTCILTKQKAFMLTIRFKPSRVGIIQQNFTIQTIVNIANKDSVTSTLRVPLIGEGIARKPDVVRFVNERMFVRDKRFFPIGWSQIGTRDNAGIISNAPMRSELKGVNFMESEGTMYPMNIGAGASHSIWKADARDYNNLDTIRYYLRRYLDTCQKGGIKTILNLYEYYADKQISGIAATGKAGTKMFMERFVTDSDLQAIIGDSIIRSHPALLGWWISSEPVGKYGEVYDAFFDGKSNPFTATIAKPKSRADVHAHITKFYPLQTELSRLYRLAKAADGNRHPIGTMFQAGSALEMTGMLNLFANPAEPFWEFILAEHYNSPTSNNNNGYLYEVFERRIPLADTIRIKNGDADGNFFYRNFRTTPPTTALTQDDLLMNRDIRDYYSRFHPSGASGGGIILKMFGHKYEGDVAQSIRPATLRELMFTTFTEIHALQNYPRPTVLGGVNIFGFDFYSEKISMKDANGTTKNIWGLTPSNRVARQEQQDFLAFLSTYNLGMVFQNEIQPEFQGDDMVKIETLAAPQNTAQSIKKIVRYHDGYIYLALINNLVNETMPPSLTTGTVRFTSWGSNQEFVTTENVRVSLVSLLTFSEAEEITPENGGTQKTCVLERFPTGYTFTIPKLDAAETRVFRFRMLYPEVAVIPAFIPEKQVVTSSLPTSKPTSLSKKSTKITLPQKKSVPAAKKR